MLNGKAKKVYGKFLTRKDFHHTFTRPDSIYVWYEKKKYRKIANKKVRRYKNYFSNSEYKKIGEVKWNVI